MLKDYIKFFFQNKKNSLITKKSFFESHSPQLLIKAKKTKLKHISQLLNVLSPKRLLKRGFSLITDERGNSIYSAKKLKDKYKFLVQFYDGKIKAEVNSVDYDKI